HPSEYVIEVGRYKRGGRDPDDISKIVHKEIEPLVPVMDHGQVFPQFFLLHPGTIEDGVQNGIDSSHRIVDFMSHHAYDLPIGFFLDVQNLSADIIDD